MISSQRSFIPLSTYWRERFGGRVERVCLEAGFSCPNRDGTKGFGGCVFCDVRSFSGAASSGPVAEQLRAGIQRLRAKGITRVASYLQTNTNTHGPLEQIRSTLRAAVDAREVVALCIGTRPDCLSAPVLDVVSESAWGREVWLEIGLQSAEDRTLERLRRGHTRADFAQAVAGAQSRGLKVCAHVILGLPGESWEDEERTASFLRELGVEGVKLHQLSVVAGTVLEAMWRAGEVSLLDEATYARRAAQFLRACRPDIVVHRLVGDVAGDGLMGPRFHKSRVMEEIRRQLEVFRADGV
jgi:radical SAM protein (TIGR01212 family)